MSTTFWIRESKREYKDKTHWAKLRIKKDKQGKQYIDVLVGRKGKRWHAHFGFNLDQSLRFAEFRGVVHSIQRDVESSKKGHLESKKIIVDPEVKPMKELILKLNIDGDTKEVTIREFRLEGGAFLRKNLSLIHI